MTHGEIYRDLHFDADGDLFLNVAAIDDDGFHGEYFTLTEVRIDPACIDRFVIKHQDESRNVYCGANLLTRTRDTDKALESDLAPVTVAHVDCDDCDPDEKCEEFNGATLTMASSDVGAQAFWKLPTSVTVAEAKAINLALVDKFNGDRAAASPVQLMRIPDTINFPSAVKRERGRKESIGRVISFNPEAELDPSTLPRPRDTFLDALPLSAEMRDLMMTGKRDDETLGNSESRFAVLIALSESGVDDDTLDALLRDYPDLPISPKDTKKNNARWRAGEIKRVAKKASPWLRKMNDKYFVCFHGGKTAIAELSKAGGREFYLFNLPAVKKDHFENRTVLIGERRVQMWRAWMTSPRRRTYENAVMRPDREPGRMPNGDFNLWRGFSVKPKPGDFGLFRELVETVICDGDPELIEYVWNWLAFLVQRPGDRHEVALVMKGGKGTGKGTLATEVGSLFGPHYLPTSNIGDIVGRFNTHLRECLLLFADEALIAKNQKHDSQIKPLITDETISCEAKGLSKIWVDNRLSWLMASNQDWVIPATRDERRYAVCNVSTCRQQDLKFFGALKKQMKNGGRAALLDHLLKIDIAKFDPKKFPDNDALREQQDQSLGALQLFWRDRLANGDHDNSGAPDFHRVPVQLLFLQAQDFARRVRRPGMPDNEIDFGRALREFLPDGYPKRGNASGFEYNNKPVVHSNVYRLPSLEICREFFAEQIIGRAIDWGDDLELDPDDEKPSDASLRWRREKEIGALYIKLQRASDPVERAKFESAIAKLVSGDQKAGDECAY